VAVKIKLKRMGKMRNPQYRIVVADARTKRDGRAIEEIGTYQPKQHPSLIIVDSARAQYWLGVGAQPTEAVAAILRVTGDWQTFKGIPGGEGTLQVAEPKANKKAIFEAAALESLGDGAPATTPRKRVAKTADKPAETADKPAETAAAVEVPAAEEPVAEAAPAAEEPAADASAAPAVEPVVDAVVEPVSEPVAEELAEESVAEAPVEASAAAEAPVETTPDA
jgi:small subunit ribosomal protein S16